MISFCNGCVPGQDVSRQLLKAGHSGAAGVLSVGLKSFKPLPGKRDTFLTIYSYIPKWYFEKANLTSCMSFSFNIHYYPTT
jgi:hypothetical protein